MQFYSALFLAFVLILAILYYTVCSRIQWVLLLAGSLAFYAWLGKSYISIIIIISFIVWLAALIIGRMNISFREKKKNKELTREDKKKLKSVFTIKKRIILVVVVSVIIGNLAAFKVFNFTKGLVLPLGLSFYTFQALSYFFDVYMDKYEYEPNYLRFLLFVSWFPQMIQGPISRYDSLGVQFRQKHKFDFGLFKYSVFLFAFGLLKKYAIADVMEPMVEAAFNNIVDTSGTTVLMGVLLSLVQLYCDFSGGIDMVLAVSGFFGFKLKDNFNQPYFSPTLADFWHRWHITLGDWMRDYIFYPLAVTKPMLSLMKWGSKHFGKIGRIFPAVVGNIVIFFLVGIWHGTGWNYVVWGLYNGVLISLGELFKPVFAKTNEILHLKDTSKILHVWKVIRTDLLVAFGELIVMIGNVALIPSAMLLLYTRPDLGFTGFNTILQSTIFKGEGDVFKMTFLIIALVVVTVRSVIKEIKGDMRVWLNNRSFVTQSFILCLLIFTMLSAFIFQNVGGGFLYANF